MWGETCFVARCSSRNYHRRHRRLSLSFSTLHTLCMYVLHHTARSRRAVYSVVCVCSQTRTTSELRRRRIARRPSVRVVNNSVAAAAAATASCSEATKVCYTPSSFRPSVRSFVRGQCSKCSRGDQKRRTDDYDGRQKRQRRLQRGGDDDERARGGGGGDRGIGLRCCFC